jgi:hypothetical protein
MRDSWLAAVMMVCTTLTATIGKAEAPIQDFQSWTQLQATIGLARALPALSLNLEGTVRRGSPAFVDKTTGQLDDAALTYLFLRPSLQLEVHKGVVVALGYAYAPVYYDEVSLRDSRNIKEQRVWEQLNLSHSFGPVNLAGRTRFEQRIRTRGPGAGDTELRLRQRFRLAVQLVKDLPWHFITTDEVFFFLNRTSFPSQPSFSENRVFAGFGYKLQTVNVEFGYLNQFVGGPNSSPHHINHVLSTSMTFSFEFEEAQAGP